MPAQTLVQWYRAIRSMETMMLIVVVGWLFFFFWGGGGGGWGWEDFLFLRLGEDRHPTCKFTPEIN